MILTTVQTRKLTRIYRQNDREGFVELLRQLGALHVSETGLKPSRKFSPVMRLIPTHPLKVSYLMYHAGKVSNDNQVN